MFKANDGNSAHVQPTNGRQFPLNDLLSFTDLDKVYESLTLIFSYINRKSELFPYPICHALPLVKATSRDFNDILLRILTSHQLAYTPYPTFECFFAQTKPRGIFRTWDVLINEFTNVAMEVTRKRSEKFIPLKVVPAHGKLVGRARYLREGRKLHEQ